ncbi:MAG: hypothetical protein EXR71_21025 [Myxococcales bacterium]|nr:hypothetical protein [Myxococcales bacterium]
MMLRASRLLKNLPSHIARWADTLGVLVSLAVGLLLWAADRQQSSALLPAGSPWWARVRDHLLDGPDAGSWAASAVALSLGRVQDLDAHRLPVLPYVTAFVLNFQPDTGLAGHLVNHVLHVSLGPVIYLLASRWMPRGMALGAAITAVTFPLGVTAADRYGVDPLVAFAIPASLLAAECAARWPAWAALYGVLVGVACTCHLTTIGMWAPALLLTLLRGHPGWRRWLGTLGLAGGVLVGVGTLYAEYPTLPINLLIGSIAEGVAPTGPTARDAGAYALAQQAVAIVLAGGPAALDGVISLLAVSTRPAWMPWAAAIALPWLGMWGPLVDPRSPGRSGLASELFGGLRAGLPLAAALVPLLAFAAAGSPPRYSANFVPLGVVLVFRGLATVPTLIDRVGRHMSSRWPRGGLALLLGLATAAGLWREDLALAPSRLPPSMRDVADWRLGAVLREHFSPGGGASCLRREAIAYAGRVYCPYSPGNNFRFKDDPHRAHLTAECTGEGPVPYVLLTGDGLGASADRLEMDAWVEANATLVTTYSDPFIDARIYAVERLAAEPDPPSDLPE